MAYKPSMRRSGVTADIELDIKPVMNLMVVLIPLLLAGVEMVKLSIIEIDLPPASAGGGKGADDKNPEKEKEKKLSLKIALSRPKVLVLPQPPLLCREKRVRDLRYLYHQMVIRI